MSLTALLTSFEQAAATRDVPRFAALFTPEGRYHDGFFGTHQGRAAIAAMLEATLAATKPSADPKDVARLLTMCRSVF